MENNIDIRYKFTMPIVAYTLPESKIGVIIRCGTTNAVELINTDSGTDIFFLRVFIKKPRQRISSSEPWMMKANAHKSIPLMFTSRLIPMNVAEPVNMHISTTSISIATAITVPIR